VLWWHKQCIQVQSGGVIFWPPQDKRINQT